MKIGITYKIKRGKRIPAKLMRLRDNLRDRTQPMNELKEYYQKRGH